MNKNEEQIKNEEITEDVDVVFRDPTAIEIDLGVVNLDTAFELYYVVKDAVDMLDENDDSNLVTGLRRIREELF